MPGKYLSLLAAFGLFLFACTRQVETVTTKTVLPVCHIIYDAGSADTRLYVYQKTGTGWLKHTGPSVSALADPLREIRGKTVADAGAVVDEIVAALEDMRSDGPIDEKGQPMWPAFDWRTHCDIKTVSVYATAGMRLAQQKDAVVSNNLWGLLNQRLSAEVGMEVTTRTLSGYEEGLFAWLALREKRDDDDFGVADLGGASLQVAFPCPQCGAARQVKVKNHRVMVYSHSFLGWGQDEAWLKFGTLPACQSGAGKDNAEWKENNCTVGIRGFSELAVDTGKKIAAAEGQNWFLSGAFRYMKHGDVEQFCRKGIDSGFEPVTSCFRAVYLPYVLNTLGLPADAKTSDVDWTLGAVVCTVTQCL